MYIKYLKRRHLLLVLQPHVFLLKEDELLIEGQLHHVPVDDLTEVIELDAADELPLDGLEDGVQNLLLLTWQRILFIYGAVEQPFGGVIYISKIPILIQIHLLEHLTYALLTPLEHQVHGTVL